MSGTSIGVPESATGRAGGRPGPDQHPQHRERVVKEQVFRPWDYPIFAVLTAGWVAAMFTFWYRWFGSEGWGRHPIVYALLSALIGVVLVNQQGRWFLLLPMKRPRPLPPSPGIRVAAVTTYVPGVEPREMLEESLAALVAMEYPHDTWLLDEGQDQALRETCARLGVRYFTRQGMERYNTRGGPFSARSKHGNYNAWLHEVGFRHYDVLAAFDPDHVPEPDYLQETIGFFADPAIGYVQAAQAFYNQDASLIARGAAEETYAYYSAVQMASYGMGYPIIVGSHNVHRMPALEAVGGFAPHDADDLLLTLRYRADGWEGVYVPRILARGLAPVDWGGYLGQQRRWARSVLDIKLRQHADYASSLPARTRIMSTLHGINFLHRAGLFAGGLVILLYLVATAQVRETIPFDVFLPAMWLVVAVQAQELYRQRFYLDWQGERGLHWRVGVLALAKWPWFLLALLDILAARRIGYVVTRKTEQSGVYTPFVAVNLGLAAVSADIWAAGHVFGPLSAYGHAAGMVTVLCFAGLALTGLRPFPPPYQRGLRSSTV